MNRKHTKKKTICHEIKICRDPWKLKYQQRFKDVEKICTLY